ncbi:MAG: hypothetical protein ACOC1F_11300 [Myxococcota bacterium]
MRIERLVCKVLAGGFLLGLFGCSYTTEIPHAKTGIKVVPAENVKEKPSDDSSSAKDD